MSIGRLLDDAMASGKARAVELAISTTYSLTDRGCDMRALNIGFACGWRFSALLDGCPGTFGGLTRLTMSDVMLRGGADFHDVLSTCTRLEALSLHFCSTVSRVAWRVRHARLAELTISYCSFFEGIDLVWLPMLQRLAHRGWWWCRTRPPMSLGHVPRLATVTLSTLRAVGEPTLKLSQMVANSTSAITDLRLNFRGQDVSST